MTPAYFRALARYNAWANRRLYAVAARLPAEALAQHRPAAFFRSIIGTLNHLLVGDRIWLYRFEGGGPQHSRLDDEPFPRFSDLQAAREVEDERIIAYAAALTAEQLAAELHYRSIRGFPQQQPLWQALAHFFNHQTHHRGQAHALLQEAGAEPPSLDLVLFQREEAKAEG
jgi:uncharacterized damage-inducible protein DinB